MEYIETMDSLFSAWKHLFLMYGLSTLVSSVVNTFLTVFSQLLVPCTITVCYTCFIVTVLNDWFVLFTLQMILSYMS